ncbi:hypothetical protein ACTXM8_10240 [Brachybacterium alimentarium]|uniref:hypothetical protein n=1 Tax=Brachybacterium alimentarium TaxID=47845 RepID=UPI003FD221C5
MTTNRIKITDTIRRTVDARLNLAQDRLRLGQSPHPTLDDLRQFVEQTINLPAGTPIGMNGADLTTILEEEA